MWLRVAQTGVVQAAFFETAGVRLLMELLGSFGHILWMSELEFGKCLHSIPVDKTFEQVMNDSRSPSYTVPFRPVTAWSRSRTMSTQDEPPLSRMVVSSCLGDQPCRASTRAAGQS